MKMAANIGEKSTMGKDTVSGSIPLLRETSLEANGKTTQCQAKASITLQTTNDTRAKSSAASSMAMGRIITKMEIITRGCGKTM